MRRYDITIYTCYAKGTWSIYRQYFFMRKHEIAQIEQDLRNESMYRSLKDGKRVNNLTDYLVTWKPSTKNAILITGDDNE